MEATAIPLYLNPSNAGLAQYAKDLKDSLTYCNADKQALKDWASLATQPTKE